MIISLGMNEDTQYWLRRVTVKLYKDFMAGMDFEHNEHRWIFDWDKNLTTEENLMKVTAENKALILLAQVGVIQSSAKANYFRDQQWEGWNRFGKESGGMWGDERWEQTDPAHREYDYIRYIDNLDYDKFIRFCTEHGINYKEEGVVATLTITEQKPSIRADGKEYSLKVLQAGLPLEIIEQAIAHSYESVTFAKIRQWTGRLNTYKNKGNFKQIFRGNEFGEGNVLHPFADISTKSFMLTSNALLTPAQLSAIQKASIS